MGGLRAQGQFEAVAGSTFLTGTATFIADGTFSIVNGPTRFEIETTPPSGSRTKRFEIAADGTVSFEGNNIQNIDSIDDSNGNQLIQFPSVVASAINEITISNSAMNDPVLFTASGGDTNVDVRFVPKGDGTFYGNRETWGWPLTDETSAPTTGLKFTTEPAPYDMEIDDVIAGLTVTGGGAALLTLDIHKETGPNNNAFNTIFSTLLTIDNTEFTSTTATTPPVFTGTITWSKGERLELRIDTLDTDITSRGIKIELVAHATAK